MKDILIHPCNNVELIKTLKVLIGGEITENFGKLKLTVDNDKASGFIKYLPFDWGVELIQLDITFSDYLNLTLDASEYNPIQFIYSSNAKLGHYYDDPKNIKYVDEFHTLILTSKEGSHNSFVFPKNKNLKLNIIQIVRTEFLKKRTTNASMLNKQLYSVFMDTDHENKFRFFGSFNLKIDESILELETLKEKGMSRILKMESLVYEILSLHIKNHDRNINAIDIPDSLLKSELKLIKKISQKIIKNPSKNYDLKSLSLDSGLSQLKLQDGFKHLFKRTVTDYIRHIRLETARDLLRNSELNISQVVYTIGFTSRSYFSKIFKERFGITPHQYKKQAMLLAE